MARRDDSGDESATNERSSETETDVEVEIDRRTTLKGAGAALAGAALFPFAGAASTSSSTPDMLDEDEYIWKRTKHDVSHNSAPVSPFEYEGRLVSSLIYLGVDVPDDGRVTHYFRTASMFMPMRRQQGTQSRSTSRSADTEADTDSIRLPPIDPCPDDCSGGGGGSDSWEPVPAGSVWMRLDNNYDKSGDQIREISDENLKSTLYAEKDQASISASPSPNPNGTGDGIDYGKGVWTALRTGFVEAANRSWVGHVESLAAIFQAFLSGEHEKVPIDDSGKRFEWRYTQQSPEVVATAASFHVKNAEQASVDGEQIRPSEIDLEIVHGGAGDGMKSVGITPQVRFDVREDGEDHICIPANPTAEFTASDDQPSVGDTVTFDADPSSKHDKIERYEWDFGDGTTATGREVEHTFDHGYDYEREYRVTLTVTGPCGETDEYGKTIDVAPNTNQSPVAKIEAASSGEPNVPVNFDGSGSTDPDGDIRDWEWDFGDGSTGSSQNTDHTYDSTGTYTVTLTVEDFEGATGTATHTIDIEESNESPNCSISLDKSTAYVNESIGMSASASDPDGSIVSYEWNFGDGSSATGQSVNHSYSDPGGERIHLTVTDDDGATCTAQTWVTIEERTRGGGA